MSAKPTLVQLILNATAAGRALLTAANAAAQKTLLSLTKSDVGLGNVDNTSDANKPVSTATQTALDGKSSTSHNHSGVYSEVGHGHAQSDITSLVSDLAAKQATLVSGTNIKTVNGSSLLGSGDLATSLTEVTITDAAVTMTANRRYVGSIAAFTADRNYKLPAGTAGDVIEVHVLTGDDTYELILIGDTGVAINGGSTATEWSRLFISNELVRFRCHATNDWRVDVDGRIRQQCLLSLATTVSSNFANNAYTRVPYDTIVADNASIGSISSDQIVPRRGGTFEIVSFAQVEGITSANIVVPALNVAGVRYTGQIVITNASLSSGYITQMATVFQIAAGDVVFAELYQVDGAARAATGTGRCRIALVEVLL